jgi:hypothetical protein
VPSKKEMNLAIPLRLLSCLDSKLPKKLTILIRHVFQLVRYSADHTISLIVEDYYKMHILALVYSIVGFPLLIGTFSYYQISYPWLWVIILPMFLPLSTEFFWRYTANGNPKSYLKVLDLKSRGIYVFFGIFVAGYVATVSLSYYAIFLNTNLLFFSLISFAVVTLMLIGFSFFVVFTLVLGNLIALFNLKNYLKITARTCFNVVTAEKDLKKGISTFKLGLECVNEYTKYSFRLGLAKLPYYCDYFKLIALSRNTEEKDRIRNALSNFSSQLISELDLTDIILATREIIGKPIFRFEEVYEELEFDVSLRKRISDHKELVTAIIGILGVILTFISIYPLLSNAWTQLHLPNPFFHMILL